VGELKGFRSERMGQCLALSSSLPAIAQRQYYLLKPKKLGSREEVWVTLSEAYVPASLAFQVIRLHKPPQHVEVMDQEENGIKMDLTNMGCEM
jgi:hypothetical protein